MRDQTDILQENRAPAEAFGWARFAGYGDNGAVMFCATQADAADADRAPRLLSEAPEVGGRAWLRLNHPFVFDSIAPFWCLFLPPAMQWHGPISDDLCKVTLVRCRLARAPSRDGEDGAAARVAVMEAHSLCDLARGPVSGDAEASLIARLTDGPGAHAPVTQGGYTVLGRDIDDISGEWAILRHDTGITDLLIYGAWDVDSDRMWAGRARLPHTSFS